MRGIWFWKGFQGSCEVRVLLYGNISMCLRRLIIQESSWLILFCSSIYSWNCTMRPLKQLSELTAWLSHKKDAQLKIIFSLFSYQKFCLLFLPQDPQIFHWAPTVLFFLNHMWKLFLYPIHITDSSCLLSSLAHHTTSRKTTADKSAFLYPMFSAIPNITVICSNF